MPVVLSGVIDIFRGIVFPKRSSFQAVTGIQASRSRSLREFNRIRQDMAPWTRAAIRRMHGRDVDLSTDSLNRATGYFIRDTFLDAATSLIKQTVGSEYNKRRPQND